MVDRSIKVGDRFWGQDPEFGDFEWEIKKIRKGMVHYDLIFRSPHGRAMLRVPRVEQRVNHFKYYLLKKFNMERAT